MENSFDKKMKDNVVEIPEDITQEMLIRMEY